jgi:hypothetical protein
MTDQFRTTTGPETGLAESEGARIPENSTLTIVRSPHAQGGKVDLATIDLSSTVARDAVRTAALEALAAGRTTPAVVKAIVSLVASAAEDQARALEQQLDRALAIIEQLRAKVETLERGLGRRV